MMQQHIALAQLGEHPLVGQLRLWGPRREGREAQLRILHRLGERLQAHQIDRTINRIHLVRFKPEVLGEQGGY